MTDLKKSSRKSKKAAADDMDFRPATYWPNAISPETVLSAIKGEARRQMAKRALAAGIGPLEAPDLFVPALDDDKRKALGRVHPQLMGGEYLPTSGEDEVEIARVSLASTTGDVISVRARRDGTVIRYRVVDEYWDVPDKPGYDVSDDTSVQPLTLGELIQLIDSVDHDSGPGLTSGFRDANLESGCTPEELESFVTVDSEFYPGLGAHYGKEAEAWRLERETSD